MALIYSAPITQARTESIRDFLNSIAGSDNLAFLGKPQAARLVVSDALPVYTFALSDIFAGRLLRHAKQHLWRHLLILNQQALAEVDAAGDAMNAEPVAVHRGPRAAATLTGLVQAEALAKGMAQHLEVRELQCTAVRFMALWLHGADPETDWLIPIEPDRTGLSLYQAVPEAEMLRVLTPLAQAVTDRMNQPGSEHWGG